jgi:hypothetical protein
MSDGDIEVVSNMCTGYIWKWIMQEGYMLESNFVT